MFRYLSVTAKSMFSTISRSKTCFDRKIAYATELISRKMIDSKLKEQRAADSVDKVIKLLEVFCICYIPNLATTVVMITRQLWCLEWHVLTVVRLAVFHDISQAIFIAYSVVNPLTVANKDFSFS